MEFPIAIVVTAARGVLKLKLLDALNAAKAVGVFFPPEAQAHEVHGRSSGAGYNLVITDNLTTAQQIRALNPSVHILGMIIAGSTDADDEQRKAFLEAGANQCIGQIVDEVRMMQIIGNLIRQ